MRVLLINPPFTGFGGLEGHGGKAAPLNLGYLASFLRMQKPETDIRILDAEGLRLGFDEVEQEVRNYMPDLIAITTPTPAYVHVLEVAKRTKAISRDIYVAVGGPQPSAFPELCAGEEDIDFAFFGESEVSFYELVERLDKGGSLEEVDGMAFKGTDGNVVVNKHRALVADLDTLPFPARDLMPLHIYYPTATKRVSGKRSANMITSRGCPYDCTYCESKVIWTRKARFRGPDNVVDEIEECVTKYGLGEFNFHDDILPLRRERTIEICREIRRRKLDISWVGMTRVNFVWDDVMLEMKKAGCRKLMFGLESGSNELLEIMKKKATVEEARDAFAICKRAGIKTMASFMLGNIGETEETVRQTIDLAKELNPDTVAFFISVPYPGTELYNVAKQKGWVREDVTWSDYTVVGDGRPIVILPDISPEELKYWQSRAIREFYLRPSYMMKKLFSLRSFQELRSVFHGVKLFTKIGLDLKKPIPEMAVKVELGGQKC
jgi:radical SAM superfamily enzyme YgiQ (UPF0313 family)